MPRYWEKTKASKAEDKLCFFPLTEEQNPDIWRELRKLLVTDGNELGIGLDARNYPKYDRLHLARAWRIEQVLLWDAYVAGQRKIISDAASVAETSVRNKMAEIEAGAYEVAKANGMKVVVPSADDIAAFKAASGSVYDAYKEKAGSLGKQLLEAASKM